MARKTGLRRRPALHITLGRASRLYRLVHALAGEGRPRDAVLGELGLGLRTFYRELELLRRCGVKVRLVNKRYVLIGTPEQAEGNLPFPDPQLSFAELAELARGPGEAARRLAALLERVTAAPPPPKPKRKRGKRP